MESYARRAGVPEETRPLFAGTGGSLLLLAKKPSEPPGPLVGQRQVA